MQARRLTLFALIALGIIGCAVWLITPAPVLYHGQTLDDWFAELRGHSEDPVIEKLREIGPDAVAYLADRIETRDSFLRDRYVAVWPKLPAFVRSRMNQPMTAAAIRVKAVGALRQMGPPFTASKVGFNALRASLKHSDNDVRSRAEGALGDLGRQAKPALPDLIKSIEKRTKTSTGHIGINGIWAVGCIGPDAKDALPLLESIVKQKHGRERVYAAESVLKIGGDKAAAIAALQQALHDPDPKARREAAQVFERIGISIDDGSGPVLY